MNNRVVVLGGRGLLGRAVAYVLSFGYDIQVLSRQDGFFIEKYETFPRLKYPVEAVVNCAGILSSGAENINELVSVNVAGSYNAARFAHANNAFFIHISSIFAIKSNINQYYGEYGISKAAGDDMIRFFCTQQRVPYAVLRFSQLYDYKGKAAVSQAMLYRLIDQLRNSGAATIFGRKNPVRNYLNIDDAAFMVKYCLENRANGLWNCIHPDNITIYDLVAEISSCLNIKGTIKVLPEKPALLSMDIPRKNLLHRIIPDFKPVSIAEGIRNIIKYGKG